MANKDLKKQADEQEQADEHLEVEPQRGTDPEIVDPRFEPPPPGGQIVFPSVMGKLYPTLAKILKSR